VIFENAVKRLTKSQFSSKKHPIACNLNKHFSAFSNRNFLKTQFPNGSFSAIWFKIVFFLYEIAILNAPEDLNSLDPF
jgi:hypothetical protein